MTNRISEVDGGTIGAGSGGPVEAVRPAGAVGSATASTSSQSNPDDQVHITSSARALAGLSSAVGQTPDIDQGRVAAVQQALDSGQYQPDAERIAARMLQLEQDLGGTRQQ